MRPLKRVLLHPASATHYYALRRIGSSASPIHDPAFIETSDTTNGDEPFRLIGGGNDVFVSVGIILLFAGGLFILNTLFGAGEQTRLRGNYAVFLVGGRICNTPEADEIFQYDFGYIF